MIEYTWIDGAFFLKEPKQWFFRHLSEFPELDDQDTHFHNMRCKEQLDTMVQLAEKGQRVEVQCNESEGISLHQIWFGGVNKLVKSPQGLTKWVNLLFFYVRFGFTERGLVGVLIGLLAFSDYWRARND